jgi:hypothetical protein
MCAQASLHNLGSSFNASRKIGKALWSICLWWCAKHHRFVIKYSLTVCVKPETFLESAQVGVISGVMVVGTATSAAGSGRLVRFWGAHLLRICMHIRCHTGLFAG